MSTRHSKTRRRAALHFAELLESRRLLSTITWTNRGVTTGASADRFDVIFGTLANQARGVVDAAIAAWQRTISSFNYGDGGQDNYNVLIQMNSSAITTPGTGVGANSGVSATRNSKPAAGSMGIGWRTGITPGTNTSSGWFLDPTPSDSTEFPTIVNAFNANASPALGASDLLTVVTHELGHCMGLYSTAKTRAIATNTLQIDSINTPASNPSSYLWLMSNGSLWTSYDSGGATGGASDTGGPQHLAPPGAVAVVNGVTYYGARGLMNAVGNGSRSSISDYEADTLRLAYGYTINKPSTFGTNYGRLQTDGTLDVNLTSLNVSADAVGISVNNGNFFLTITEGSRVQGIDPTTITEIFTQSLVKRVNIQTGDGDDSISIQPIGATVPITVDGGGGINSMTIYGSTGNDDVTINAPTLTLSDKINITLYTLISNLTLELNSGNATLTAAKTGQINNIRLNTVNNGLNESQTITVNSLDQLTPLTVEAFSGDDTLNVGGTIQDLYAIRSAIRFIGDAGNDTLNIVGRNTEASFYALVGDEVDYYSLVTSGPQGAIRFSTTETVNIYAGNGDDGFTAITSPAGLTQNLYGGGGNDGLSTGDAGSGVGLDDLLGPINFHGEAGSDLIQLDDMAAAGNRTYIITSTSVKSQTSPALGVDAENVTLSGVQSFLGIYNFSGTTNVATRWVINGNALADQFRFGTNALFNGTLNGGAGSDGLTVDDRTSSTNIFRMNLTATTLSRDFGIPASFNTYTITMNDLDLPSYYPSPNTNTINVLGTPASAFGYYFTLYGSANADLFTLTPHDAVTGAATFLSRLDIAALGGSDKVIFDDSASAAPVAYTASQPGGPNFGVYIDSPDLPQTLIEKDLEAIQFNGSAYADSYTIASSNISQTYSINGGDGNDSLVAGGGNLPVNVPAIGSVFFDGQGDSDSFLLDNHLVSTVWTYTRQPTYIQANGPSYVVGFHTTAETNEIDAGSGSDSFAVQGNGPGAVGHARAPANGYLDILNGGGGTNGFVLTNGNLTNGITATTRLIGAGNDEVAINNSNSSIPVTAHYYEGHVGDVNGDNLFGPGGALEFTGISALRTYFFNAATTAFVEPGTSTAFSVNANPAQADNYLGLADAAAGAPTTSAGVGGLTIYHFPGSQYVAEKGFATIVEDNVAPAAVAADFLWNAPVQTLTFSFSENASNTLDVGALAIVNTDTGEAVDTTGFAFTDYDTNTQTVSFTFPPLLNGALPDGHYEATLQPYYRDDFGNAATEPIAVDFFSLAGDANHDGAVNFTDLVILAQHYNQTGLSFSEGNFDYSSDGAVNFADLVLLAQHYGHSLITAASLGTQPQSLAKRRPIADVLA